VGDVIDRLRIAVGEPSTGVLVVAVAGECDLDSAPELEFALAQTPGADVYVDLSEVSFLDSTTLNVLIRAKRRADDEGSVFALVRVSAIVGRVLEVANLERLFDIRDSESARLDLDALARMNGGSTRALFLRLNERDRRMGAAQIHPRELDLFCECDDESCWRVVSVPAEVYARIRLHADRYVLHPLHVPQVAGSLVEASELYVVVRDDAPVRL
jgi:anti-sigma B factor antagonist